MTILQPWAEYISFLATLTGFEPVISALTGRRSALLSYSVIADMGFEPMYMAYEAIVEPLQLNPQSRISDLNR